MRNRQVLRGAQQRVLLRCSQVAAASLACSWLQSCTWRMCSSYMRQIVFEHLPSLQQNYGSQKR
jgi:hypothetical protein